MATAISQISIKIKAITSPFIKGISQAIPIVGKFTSVLKSLAGSIIKVGTVAIVAFTAALTFTLVKILKVTASLESLETQFMTLLGTAGRARQRMAELKKFSAETPFQIEGIAKASKILQTLTKGVLASGKGLQLVGDAAAIAGRPIEELAVQIGRAFQGAATGRAVGEALARLQELGILSGEARTEFERLQKAGEKGQQVWKVLEQDMRKTQGAMKALSKTAAGLFSTLKDNLNLAMAEFGAIMQPIVKLILTGAIEKFQSLKDMIIDNKDAIKAFIIEGIEKIGPAFVAFSAVAKKVFSIIIEFFKTNGPGAVDGFFKAIQLFFINVEFFLDNWPKAWSFALKRIMVEVKQIGRDMLITFVAIFRNIGIKLINMFKLAFDVVVKLGTAKAKTLGIVFLRALAPPGLRKTFDPLIEASKKAEDLVSLNIDKAFLKSGETLKQSVAIIEKSGFGKALGSFEDDMKKLNQESGSFLEKWEKFVKLKLDEQAKKVKEMADAARKAVAGPTFLERLSEQAKELALKGKELGKEFGNAFMAPIFDVTNAIKGAVETAGAAADKAAKSADKIKPAPAPELALAGSQAAARAITGQLGKSPLVQAINNGNAILKRIENKMGEGQLGAANFGFGGG